MAAAPSDTDIGQEALWVEDAPLNNENQSPLNHSSAADNKKATGLFAGLRRVAKHNKKQSKNTSKAVVLLPYNQNTTELPSPSHHADQARSLLHQALTKSSKEDSTRTAEQAFAHARQAVAPAPANDLPPEIQASLSQFTEQGTKAVQQHVQQQEQRKQDPPTSQESGAGKGDTNTTNTTYAARATALLEELLVWKPTKLLNDFQGGYDYAMDDDSIDVSSIGMFEKSKGKHEDMDFEDEDDEEDRMSMTSLNEILDGGGEEIPVVSSPTRNRGRGRRRRPPSVIHSPRKGMHSKKKQSKDDATASSKPPNMVSRLWSRTSTWATGQQPPQNSSSGGTTMEDSVVLKLPKSTVPTPQAYTTQKSYVLNDVDDAGASPSQAAEDAKSLQMSIAQVERQNRSFVSLTESQAHLLGRRQTKQATEEKPQEPVFLSARDWKSASHEESTNTLQQLHMAIGPPKASSSSLSFVQEMIVQNQASKDSTTSSVTQEEVPPVAPTKEKKTETGRKKGRSNDKRKDLQQEIPRPRRRIPKKSEKKKSSFGWFGKKKTTPNKKRKQKPSVAKTKESPIDPPVIRLEEIHDLEDVEDEEIVPVEEDHEEDLVEVPEDIPRLPTKSFDSHPSLPVLTDSSGSHDRYAMSTEEVKDTSAVKDTYVEASEEVEWVESPKKEQKRSSPLKMPRVVGMSFSWNSCKKGEPPEEKYMPATQKLESPPSRTKEPQLERSSPSEKKKLEQTDLCENEKMMTESPPAASKTSPRKSAKSLPRLQQASPSAASKSSSSENERVLINTLKQACPSAPPKSSSKASDSEEQADASISSAKKETRSPVPQQASPSSWSRLSDKKKGEPTTTVPPRAPTSAASLSSSSRRSDQKKDLKKVVPPPLEANDDPEKTHGESTNKATASANTNDQDTLSSGMAEEQGGSVEVPPQPKIVMSHSLEEAMSKASLKAREANANAETAPSSKCEDDGADSKTDTARSNNATKLDKNSTAKGKSAAKKMKAFSKKALAGKNKPPLPPSKADADDFAPGTAIVEPGSTIAEEALLKGARMADEANANAEDAPVILARNKPPEELRFLEP